MQTPHPSPMSRNDSFTSESAICVVRSAVVFYSTKSDNHVSHKIPSSAAPPITMSKQSFATSQTPLKQVHIDRFTRSTISS